VQLTPILPQFRRATQIVAPVVPGVNRNSPCPISRLPDGRGYQAQGDDRCYATERRCFGLSRTIRGSNGAMAAIRRLESMYGLPLLAALGSWSVRRLADRNPSVRVIIPNGTRTDAFDEPHEARVVLRLTFPYYDHAPTAAPQSQLLSLIPLGVGAELRRPEFKA